MKDYLVREIPKVDTRAWTELKHYAHHFPKIYFSYGLFCSDKLVGVCTLGPCARMLNNGVHVFAGKIEVRTIELNRLVVEDGLPENTLSFFVGQVFKLLPKPLCIVSYADANYGHHGYIYQATNWVYTGLTQKEVIYRDKNTGKRVHPRQISYSYGTKIPSLLPANIETSKETSGKHRYFMFLGDKKQVKEMHKNLKYKKLAYPKGENTRYDSSAVIHTSLSIPFDKPNAGI